MVLGDMKPENSQMVCAVLNSLKLFTNKDTKGENSGCVEMHTLTPVWKARVGQRSSENETAAPKGMGCLKPQGIERRQESADCGG